MQLNSAGPLKKLDAVREVLTQYRNDPHLVGRAKQVAGGLLVADGLVGLENPLDGKKSRPGIAGALFLMVFGLVFVAAGWFVLSGAGMKTDTVTTGHVVKVTEHRGDDGTTCSLLAEFTAAGRTYTADTFGSSSDDCGTRTGDPVEVKYLAENPAQAQVKSSGVWFAWVFPAVGAFIMLGGLFRFILCVASIVGGVALLLSGRKMVREHPTSTSDVDGAVSQLKEQLTGLLVGMRGDVTGQGADTSATAAAPTAAENPHVAPPVLEPGWYSTADGRHERYWDGSTWSTEARLTGQ